MADVGLADPRGGGEGGLCQPGALPQEADIATGRDGGRVRALAKLKDLSRALQVTVGWLLGMDEPAPAADPEGTRNPTPPRPRHDSPDAILADYEAPIGLRDFAQSKQVVAGLQIKPEEWAALSSFDYAEGLTKDGYCALLMVLRSASIQTTRQQVKARPGRPLGCDVNVTTTG